MSDNHEFIIPAGNPVKKFPSRLQELYLSVCENGQPPICHQRLTEQNLKRLIRKIHKRKTLGASLSCPDRNEDYFEIEVNPSWIAFEYVVNNGMEDEAFYSSFNPAYLDSDEESNTGTIYGSFMQLRYTMQDPKLALTLEQLDELDGKYNNKLKWDMLESDVTEEQLVMFEQENDLTLPKQFREFVLGYSFLQGRFYPECVASDFCCEGIYDKKTGDFMPFTDEEWLFLDCRTGEVQSWQHDEIMLQACSKEEFKKESREGNFWFKDFDTFLRWLLGKTIYDFDKAEEEKCQLIQKRKEIINEPQNNIIYL